MNGLLRFILAILVSPFRSKARLEAEIATLRQQLIGLQRKSRGRVRLTHGDRLLLLYRWFPSILPVLQIVRPETLVRWPRLGFAATGDGDLGIGEGARRLIRGVAGADWPYAGVRPRSTERDYRCCFPFVLHSQFRRNLSYVNPFSRVGRAAPS